MHGSCTASRRGGARKSLLPSLTGLARRSGAKPRTGCIPPAAPCFGCSKESDFARRRKGAKKSSGAFVPSCLCVKHPIFRFQESGMTKKKLKVVLAYSGGLDTSIILKWLQTEYDAEVVTFTADPGQGEEVEPARRKAEMLGVRPENIFIEDLREEFVRDFVFPMFRANTQYEGDYLLGTSIARPLIAKRQLEI